MWPIALPRPHRAATTATIPSSAYKPRLPLGSRAGCTSIHGPQLGVRQSRSVTRAQYVGAEAPTLLSSLLVAIPWSRGFIKKPRKATKNSRRTVAIERSAPSPPCNAITLSTKTVSNGEARTTVTAHIAPFKPLLTVRRSCLHGTSVCATRANRLRAQVFKPWHASRQHWHLQLRRAPATCRTPLDFAADDPILARLPTTPERFPRAGSTVDRTSLFAVVRCRSRHGPRNFTATFDRRRNRRACCPASRCQYSRRENHHRK